MNHNYPPMQYIKTQQTIKTLIFFAWCLAILWSVGAVITWLSTNTHFNWFFFIPTLLSIASAILGAALFSVVLIGISCVIDIRNITVQELKSRDRQHPERKTTDRHIDNRSPPNRSSDGYFRDIEN